MSDLHAQIMNIPCDRPDTSAMGKATAYKLGHRDARHAAAEMALSSVTLTLSAAMQLPEVRELRDAATQFAKAAMSGSDLGWPLVNLHEALAPFTEGSA